MRDQYFPKGVIEFVAKTGFVSKEMWEQFFFMGGKSRWKHQAWADLTKRGYLVRHSNKRLKNIYVLNRHNRVVAEVLSHRAAKPPMAAQIEHDEVLGEGLLMAERGQIISSWRAEPELKAYSGIAHRIETQGELIKYPDALVQFVKSPEGSPVAVELEMTLKNRTRYDQTMGAYAGMRDVVGVLFICKAPVIERALREAVKRTYFPTEEIKLVFVPLQEWQVNPCGVLSEIHRGTRNRGLNPGNPGLHSDCTVCRPAA
ncbi:MAG TPA: hypothetical protein DCS07_11825 [Bdellovibrionales bacterium]|nr:MAG: hypothetical protein A2Z97_03525 [Bdellovibrionales bacterium GWB1_52_6]OFZ04034.1 MAG: hypothetical protein A2X97_14620 [Bdellovibrionales bacterium GWA1_52_35]OFZ35238.1 MAG: hypothetical protein A2070_04940 [Bdellovibrionales bacterium GWC1_52_8]HAR43297.1 hypothetical protein [Bdellovibrionales bacterium]HCM39881.1 hypothetical protein [Bdellovibrionales bacterium]